MKLTEIIDARRTIDGFADTPDIGVHLAYMMTKFIVATQTDADFYANEMKKILEKYGEKTDDGNFSVKSENMDTVQELITKLKNTEATDPGIRFSLSEMTQGLKLSMKQVYPLMAFIDDEH